MKRKAVDINPARPETKNDWDAKDGQQITRP
jgi:hypothetical protein